MELRPYQREAVEVVYEFLRTREDHPCVVIPTAGGKTPVIATICRDAVQRWDGRVVILAHVKELLEQAVDKLRAVAPDLPVGVYSAGLKRRDLGYAVTVAGIQSVYQRACDVGPADLVIVDEAHLIPPDGEGMYRRFLADMAVVNPSVRVIGLTATPFRMKTGTICGPPPEHILNEVCYEVGVRELIVQGYLCPLRTKAGTAQADTSALHVRGGEFVADEVEDLMDDDALVDAACAEIAAETAERRATLIFCSGVRHGRHVARVLAERHGLECGFVCGETPTKERDGTLGRFRAGDLRYLANVNVLTTGFDAPHIDCVALLRPTLSPGLYYQMVGRGFRLHPDKADCLVLDYGGNVLRHGPVDAIRIEKPADGDGSAPAKECPACHALIHAAYQVCPECGHEFPEPQRTKHDARATSEGILSGQVIRREEHVSESTYHVHFKRDAPDAPPTMRVEYRTGLNTWAREWVCFEHPPSGYARRKAEQWWRARSSEPVPGTVAEAVELAEMGALAPTLSITIEKKAGDPYERVVAHRLGERPEAVPVGDPDQIDEEDIPF